MYNPAAFEQGVVRRLPLKGVAGFAACPTPSSTLIAGGAHAGVRADVGDDAHCPCGPAWSCFRGLRSNETAGACEALLRARALECVAQRKRCLLLLPLPPAAYVPEAKGQPGFIALYDHSAVSGGGRTGSAWGRSPAEPAWHSQTLGKAGGGALEHVPCCSQQLLIVALLSIGCRRWGQAATPRRRSAARASTGPTTVGLCPLSSRFLPAALLSSCFLPALLSSCFLPALVSLYFFFAPPPSCSLLSGAPLAAQLMWNATGTAVLALTTADVDATNQSYYGEQKLYWLAADGSEEQAVPLPKVGREQRGWAAGWRVGV